MTWIDAFIIVVFIVSGLLGVYRGVLREILSLAVWGLALYLASRFSVTLTQLHPILSSPYVASAVMFVLIFIVVLLVGLLLVRLISGLISKTPLGPLNRLLGGVFGVLRACVITAVLIWIGEATPLATSLAWQHSWCVPYGLMGLLHLQAGLAPFLHQYAPMTQTAAAASVS
jgi:membrane protein required for colicin V production